MKQLLSPSTWEDSAALKAFELFDKTKKSDGSEQSFVNRLMAAFEEVGANTTLKSVKAFVLLQSWRPSLVGLIDQLASTGDADALSSL